MIEEPTIQDSNKCTLEYYLPAIIPELQTHWQANSIDSISDFLVKLTIHILQNHPNLINSDIFEEIMFLSDILIQQTFIDSDDPAKKKIGKLFFYGEHNTLAALVLNKSIDLEDPDSIPDPSTHIIN